MQNTLLTLGLVSLAAAIVGGGIKAFGVEIPIIGDRRRQMLLALFGAVLCIAALGTYLTSVLFKATPIVDHKIPSSSFPSGFAGHWTRSELNSAFAHLDSNTALWCEATTRANFDLVINDTNSRDSGFEGKIRVTARTETHALAPDRQAPQQSVLEGKTVSVCSPDAFFGKVRIVTADLVWDFREAPTSDNRSLAKLDLYPSSCVKNGEDCSRDDSDNQAEKAVKFERLTGDSISAKNMIFERAK